MAWQGLDTWNNCRNQKVFKLTKHTYDILFAEDLPAESAVTENELFK